MAYTDTVLAKNPIQYCTLTDAAVSSSSKDLTGNGYNIPGYTSSTTRPPLVPGQNIGAISTVAGPNPLGVMVRAGEKRKYSIELWATLNGWTFGTDNSSAKTIIQNDDSTCKIYAENSFIKFLITDSDGKEYIASTNFNDWGQAFHLVASYSPDGFSISVNADISDSEVLPKSSTFKSTSSDLLTLNNTNFTLSHFAVYPKKLTTDEINSNYQAGKNFLNKNSAAKAMGANTYSLSMTDSSYAYQKTIRSNDFIVGNIRNLVLDKDAIKCVEYKPIVVRDSSAVEVSPDYTASPAYLPIASARHAKIDAIPGLSSSSGYVGVQVKVAAAAQQILTIYSKAYKKSWSWYLDASRYLHLKITTYDVEDSSTSVIYDYQNQAPVQDNQKIWFTFDESGIKVSGWGTGGTPSGFNPNRLSGTSDSYVDNLVQQIIIDGTTELLFNTDESYAGSTGDRLYYLWIGSAVPASWTSDFTVLDDAENLSFWYDLTSGKNGVNAKSQGEWTYTFDPSFQSPYYGSFVDYDLANDGLSTVKLKYVNGSYVEVKKKSHFPTSVIPFSGSFGKHLITNITDPSPGGATGTAKNLLTANQASTETDASGWNTFDNSSVARIASPVPPTTYSGVSGARFTGSGLSLTGTLGNYASSPNAAPLQITGDIDLRCKVSLDDWTPSTENDLIAKEVTTVVRAYRFYVLPSGVLGILVSFNGIDQIAAQSSVATGITDGSTKWVRATRVASTGLVRFFLSDDGTSWTQLGTDQSTTAGDIFNSSSSLDIGSRHTGTSLLTKGTIYRAQILNGIDGTLAFDANFENVSEYSAKMIESSDNSAVVTLNTTFKSAEFSSGSWSLELTRGSTPADDGRALSNPRPAVIPGQTYTASALIDGHTNGGTILLFFYNSSGNGVGQVNGSNVPAGVTERRTVSMVAPPTAASAGLIIVTNSTAGATRFDNMGIWAGTPQQIVSRTATTSEPHGFSVGNTVTISGSSTLSETVVITEADSTTFTYTSAESGYYDPTDTVISDGESGPISVQAVLSSSNLTANRPELNYIKMYIYSNSSLKGDSAIGNCAVSGSSVIIKPEEENIFHSGKKLNCTFNASSGYIQLPVVSEGDYRSIEFTFTVQGTLTAGSVLLSSRNTLNTSTNQLLISASNVVTVSGLDWPSSAVYINGNLLSSGTQTALTDSVNHVLIIADRTTDKSLYLNSNYDNTLWVSGASKYSSYGYINVWDYALSADQITSILASRQGIISGTPVFPALENSVLFAENTATYINTNPWSADSVI